MSNKSLLLVVTRFPYPLTTGETNKNFNLIKFLGKSFDVTLVVVCRELPNRNERLVIEGMVNKLVIFKPRIRDIVFGLTACLMNRQPLHFALFYSSAAKSYIDSIANTVDVVMGSVCRSWAYLYNVKNSNLYMDLADSLAMTFKANANVVGNVVLKYLYLVESRALRRTERRIVSVSKMSFLFNPIEVESLRKYGNVSLVPHGVHDFLLQPIVPDTKYCNDIVYFGKMDYAPNEDAVIWFVENILDKLPAHVKLVIIGISPSLKVQELAYQNRRVSILGFIDNPYPLISGSLCLVAPLRMGGGIQNKVLESLAVGANVLMTPKVGFALPDIDTSGCVICRSENEWIQHINRLLKQTRTGREVPNPQGPIYIERHFTWHSYQEIIMESLLK